MCIAVDDGSIDDGAAAAMDVADRNLVEVSAALLDCREQYGVQTAFAFCASNQRAGARACGDARARDAWRRSRPGEWRHGRRSARV